MLECVYKGYTVVYHIFEHCLEYIISLDVKQSKEPFIKRLIQLKILGIHNRSWKYCNRFCLHYKSIAKLIRTTNPNDVKNQHVYSYSVASNKSNYNRNMNLSNTHYTLFLQSCFKKEWYKSISPLSTSIHT